MPGLYDPRINLQRPAVPREGLMVYQALFMWEAMPGNPRRVDNYLYGRIRPVPRDRIPQNLPAWGWRGAQQQQQGPNAGQRPEQQPAQEGQNPPQREQNRVQRQQNAVQPEQIPVQPERNVRPLENLIQQLYNRIQTEDADEIVNTEETDGIDR